MIGDVLAAFSRSSKASLVRGEVQNPLLSKRTSHVSALTPSSA